METPRDDTAALDVEQQQQHEHVAVKQHEEKQPVEVEVVLSKRQRKKQLRAQETFADRQEHRKKVKRESKHATAAAAGPQTAPAEYTIANGACAVLIP